MAPVIGLIFAFLQFADAGTWEKNIDQKTHELLKNADGNYGIYIKSLPTGETFSWDANRKWYLASGVKLAIANEFYNQIKTGKIKADDKIKISAADYRDGAGQTNNLPIGSLVTSQYLMNQMLIESDNAAADILIKILGLENINNDLKKTVPEGFSDITSLLDVRKLAFTQITDKACDLTNSDFLQIKRIRSERKKFRWLIKRLAITSRDLKSQSLREAFEKYYSTGVNSGTLIAYSQLLESALPNTELVDTMAKATTGSERIRKGLSQDLTFAHKTGTQLARICDMGVIYRNDPKKSLIVVMCAEKFKSQPAAEKVFRQMGKIISDLKLI